MRLELVRGLEAHRQLGCGNFHASCNVLRLATTAQSIISDVLKCFQSQFLTDKVRRVRSTTYLMDKTSFVMRTQQSSRFQCTSFWTTKSQFPRIRGKRIAVFTAKKMKILSHTSIIQLYHSGHLLHTGRPSSCLSLKWTFTASG